MRVFLFLLFYSFFGLSNTPHKPSKEDLQFRVESRRYFDAIGNGNLRRVMDFVDSYSHRVPPVINHTDAQGWSGLHHAAFYGRLDILNFLISRGADVNVWNNVGSTPIHLAGFSENQQITEVLIENDADINATNKGGFTPLHVAIQRENLPVIKILLSQWADILIPTKSGKTTLHLAMRRNSYTHLTEDIIRLLLIDFTKSDETMRKKAMIKLITAKDKNGDTALHEAVSRSNFRAVKVLLEYEDYIDVNAQNKFDETPAHKISSHPINKAIINLLIQAGAKMDIPNENKQTPWDIVELHLPKSLDSLKQQEKPCY